jgi:hypothetical protein
MKREYVRQVLECASPSAFAARQSAAAARRRLALFGSGLLSPKRSRLVGTAVQDAAALTRAHFDFGHET